MIFLLMFVALHLASQRMRSPDTSPGTSGGYVKWKNGRKNSQVTPSINPTVQAPQPTNQQHLCCAVIG